MKKLLTLAVVTLAVTHIAPTFAAPHGLSDATVENLYGACVVEHKAKHTFRDAHAPELGKKQARRGMVSGGVVAGIAVLATGGVAMPLIALMGGTVVGGMVGVATELTSQYNQWDNESRDAAIPCTDDLIKTFSLAGKK